MLFRISTICLGLVIAAVAWGGRVVARDGEIYDGEISFKAGAKVAINPPGGAAVTLALDEVQKLWLVNEPQLPAATASGSLPGSWQQGDVGKVHFPGDAKEKEGTFTLQGYGWGIWGVEDSFHMVYQTLAGDGDIIARVVDLPSDENRFLTGLTIREGLNPCGLEVSLLTSPSSGWRFNSREALGFTRRQPSGANEQAHWIRLVRIGDVCNGFCSQDGKNWIPVGMSTRQMSKPLLIGMVCAATSNQTVVSSRFDHVSVRDEPMGPVRGLGLVDGSLIAGDVEQFDDQSIRYVDANKQPHTLPLANVANIFIRPVTADIREGTTGGKPGVALLTGDMVEGDIKGLDAKKLTIVSLVFGVQKIDWPQVRTVSLRPVAPVGSYLVGTRDGSIYRCKSLTLGDGILVAQSPAAGELKLKLTDLTMICNLH